MPKKKNKSKQGDDNIATEDFRIYLDEVIRDFMNDASKTELDFPPNFSRPMRAYVHEKCQKLGIKSKSHGKEPNRILSLIKKTVSGTAEEVHLTLAPQTQQILQSVDQMSAIRNVEYKRSKMQYDSIGKVFQGSITCVMQPKASKFTEFRKTLPIYQNKELILDTIKKNQVVVVSAETGSGKTTQIPQFIIEEAADHNKKVRVICTQPRRLSTVAVAERVAAERGEQIGSTVGYQIKLESKLGMNTAVIYCTNGVLLRTLMSGEECFQHISHIIVDEIHERDKFTDFLLITLRENAKKFPNLRLILMSATMDMDAFVRYFDNNAFVLSIEGRSFSCCSWFLEDILHHINYENARMKELRMLRERNGVPAYVVTKYKPTDSYAILDEECKMELNDIMARCFDQGTEADFDDLMQMYINENVNPNYQDWSEKTALMAAAKHGNLRIIEQLLNMGADMFLACAEGITASGWAQQTNKVDVVNMLALYQQTNPVPELTTSESGILADYDRTINDEFVDYDLIIEIIKHIHFNLGKEGAILVFLSGYEDIVACQDRIVSSNLPQTDYVLFMLHGSMQMQDQHHVFKKFPTKQKIILATNIAETSITIDDVRFVIDSGKAKIKTYDARTGITSLKSEWISMANSRQRAGRAGRTQNGYCFHLYSSTRYEAFYVNPIPEILRTPLYELCLQTKMLSAKRMSISEFLNLAIDPPQKVAVEEAIGTLKCLGALDELENMTHLGQHLVQFSIEPRLGKMLLYSVIFKCLDPVLTIAASMAQKDPFVLPSQAHLKQIALEKRKQLGEDSLSDHMIFLRAFQMWQDNKVQNRGYQFCNSNFISPAVMELIMQTRAQLLSQLRALSFVQANSKESIAELNINSNCWPVVKCCLAAGLYPNVAFYNDRNLHTKFDNVAISGQSLLKNSAFDGKGHAIIKQAWLIYDEVSKPRIKTTVKSSTVITPLTVALLCGHNTLSNGNSLLLDDSYEFVTNNNKVVILRNNIQHIIYQKIIAPYSRVTFEQHEILRIFAEVMVSEDIFYNISAPEGIGKRPRLTHTSMKNNLNSSYQHRDRYNNSHQRGNNAGPSDWSFNQQVRQLFPPHAFYFVIKPFEEKNIIIGVKQCLWNFAPQTEKKLFKYFSDGHLVFLIFHVRNSNELHGIARLLDTNQGIPNQPCPVEWYSSNKVPLYRVKNLVHGKVHLHDDGQQLDTQLAQRLAVTIFENGPNRNMCLLQNNGSARPILGNYPRAGPSRNYR